MKKFLLTAVLIVAVLTSLTAGTLAAYTQTQTIEQANAVETIKFKFNKDGSEGFASPVSLVPGTSKMYRVTVKNESEVPVVFKTAALLTGDATFLTYLVTGWFSDYAGTSPVSNTFTLAVNESTNIYLLRHLWRHRSNKARTLPSYRPHLCPLSCTAGKHPETVLSEVGANCLPLRD